MANVKKMKMQMKKNENKKATMKRQLRTQEFRKSLDFFDFFIIIFFIFLSLFFLIFFYHFLQVKSQFCSRSSLNAGKTEEAREKTLNNSKNWEQIKAQSWKLQAK